MKGEKVFINNNELVFFHFHQFGKYENGLYELGFYPLSSSCIDIIYKQYFRELNNSIIFVKSYNNNFNYEKIYNTSNLGIFKTLKFHLINLKRRLNNSYNIYKPERLGNVCKSHPIEGLVR